MVTLDTVTLDPLVNQPWRLTRWLKREGWVLRDYYSTLVVYGHKERHHLVWVPLKSGLDTDRLRASLAASLGWLAKSYNTDVPSIVSRIMSE